MAKINFTEDQQSVIDHSIADILVSAAAGSGKTAVLVERIMREITSGITSIDRILVVTFTRNAAQQMKDKIYKKLTEAAENDPENETLQKQLNLLPYANIMTIDSFCQNIVKENFEQIPDLDPNFRIGDDTELLALWEQALDETFEKHLAEGDEEVKTLFRAYGTKNNDSAVRDMVSKLHKFSDSAPWPISFLDGWAENMKPAKDVDEFNAGTTGRFYVKQMKDQLNEIVSQAETLRDLCTDDKDVIKVFVYADNLVTDLKPALQLETHSELTEFFKKFVFPGTVRKSPKMENAKNGATIIKLKETVNSSLGTLKSMIPISAEASIKDSEITYPIIQTLLSLTKDCVRTYQALLVKNNVYGFPDLEHRALAVLRTEPDENNNSGFTESAKRYSDVFDEIMIDEYQDSNDVQEAILVGVSRTYKGEHNIFTVGDVKQSIYKFRLAKPELFINKYKKYMRNPMNPNEALITLNRNFRSRKPILDFVNRIFKRIMIEEVGGVGYDEKAELVHGRTEKITWDKEHEQVEYYRISQEGDKRKNLANEVADRIEWLTSDKNNYLIEDDSEQGFHICRKSDIVILVRGLDDNAYEILRTLEERNIDCYMPSVEGYFSTPEVSAVVDFLRVLDNPYQDIPLCNVLHSMMFRWSEDDLAKLRIAVMKMVLEDTNRITAEELNKPGKKRSVAALYKAANEKDYYFFEAVEWLSKREPDSETGRKCSSFLSLYETLRTRKNGIGVDEFLELVYECTGFFYFCAGTEGGSVKRDNLNLLLRQARAFAGSRYNGLSDFIESIDRKISYEIKLSDTASERIRNAVRIMTIHKSKGLEFPVVILPCLFKRFNTQDLSDDILLHEVYGIGPTVKDIKRRTARKALQYEEIKDKMKAELLGEELRVLYTALTRPQDKLILFGYAPKTNAGQGPEPDDEKEYENDDEEPKKEDELNIVSLDFTDSVDDAKLTAAEIKSCKSYQKWIDRALVKAYTKADLETEPILIRDDSDLPTDVPIVTENVKYRELPPLEPLSEEESEIYRRYSEFTYSYRQDAEVPQKFSVSELKLAAMEELDATALPSLPSVQMEKDELIPDFIRKQQEKSSEEPRTKSAPKLYATDRGTIVHRIMELHDFTRTGLTEEEITREMELQISEKRLDSRAFSVMKPKQIRMFYDSELGIRMSEAAKKNRLSREQAFVMAMDAKEINPRKYTGDAAVLIQGEIDVFFEEDDGIVLMDYKTDRVTGPDGEKTLCDHYREQLNLYAKAITKATGRPVKEKIIYSFALNKSIVL